MKSGKIWGITEAIFANESFQLHRVEIKKGGYCSNHEHKFRANMFYVESGHIKIFVEKSDYDLKEETDLRTGEKMIVNPGDYHKFRALEKTIAYEIYFPPPVLNSDIKRKDVGGISG